MSVDEVAENFLSLRALHDNVVFVKVRCVTRDA